MPVESVTCGLGVCMEDKQLPSTEGEHRVVEAPARLVLVEDGCGGEQLAVPASASLEIGHGYSEVGDGWQVRHSGLLIDGGRTDVDDSSSPAIGPIKCQPSYDDGGQLCSVQANTLQHRNATKALDDNSLPST
jgi:hypothetical protein